MTSPAAHRGRWWLVATAALLIAGLGVCEFLGWPFLATPAQQWLASTLQRPVKFSENAEKPVSFRLHLLGGVRLELGYLEIAAPSWSAAPHLLRARDASLELRYADLWRARQGQLLRIHALRASDLDADVQRLADGRASWQFGPQNAAADPQAASPLPTFGTLEVTSGALRYRDAPLALYFDARLALTDGAAPSNANANINAAAGGQKRSLTVTGGGSYRKLPFKIDIASSGVLPWLADAGEAPSVPITLSASVGRAELGFKGTAVAALNLQRLSGAFTVSGPSLSAVGDPLGVTLPTTRPFRIAGGLVRTGEVWQVALSTANVGASRLGGAFRYDATGTQPLLSGRLTGSKLVLADLAPAIGAPAEPAVKSASAASTGRVLPTRAFDFPSLRAMDANVLVDLDDVDLGSTWLQALKPLRGHLQLQQGVLSLTDLDARTAQGRLAGELKLDGREQRALWTSDLRWAGVRLEQWVSQPRDKGLPPYISGSLSGRATLAGQGRSTAEILGSLQGQVRSQLRNGSVSHLAIEAAGLDVAQALGVFIKGDDALRVNCAVADLTADQGLLRPRVMVVDTADSAVWVEGSLSLATEALDLRAVVAPKDFSPLSLRTPLHVRGSFAKPEVSLEKGPLVRRVGAAALLALLNPLAALIPLIDTGNADDAKAGISGCEALAKRSVATR